MKYLFLVAFLIIPSAWAQPEFQRLANILRDLDGIGKNIDRMVNPPLCNIDREVKVTSLQNEQGKSFETSLISYEYLMDLYPKIEEEKSIPKKYLEDNGEARAHKVALLFDSLGINSAKVFLEGDLSRKISPYSEDKLQWKSQVANVVRVIKDGKEMSYVIAPGLYYRPIALEEWSYGLGGSPEEVSYAPKYVYHLKDKKQVPESYRPQDEADMEKKFKKQRSILKDGDQNH